MKVFVAGATGAIGLPLVRRLLDDGHEVIGMTRSAQRAAALEATGVEAIVADALDTETVRRAVTRARPSVVIDQLTDLPQRIAMRGLTKMYRKQNKLRQEGSATLLRAAREASVATVIAQSVAFIYAPDGVGYKTEDDTAWRQAPPPFGQALAVAADHDAQVVGSPDFTGIVLRYGVFYGPRTHFAPGNGVYEDAAKRRLPLVGDGSAVWSFVHVDDAAAATAAALEHASAGIYNIVDDEPVPYRDWVPFYTDLLGAKRPRHLPTWLSRVIAGPAITAWATQRDGVSNAKAKRELGWFPQHPSWREGFTELIS